MVGGNSTIAWCSWIMHYDFHERIAPTDCYSHMPMLISSIEIYMVEDPYYQPVNNQCWP
jgi:hypothetical protein